ncbi:MAG: sulfotransferase [Chloroflexi bacterium]|nr:MAG: sulfotransferase [Chloroflexota bacterium]
MGLILSELHSYGLNEALLKRFLGESKSFQEFCQKFFEHFAALRGKEASLFFEKTPQNIHNAKLFLETFPDSVFLHIVRNPLYIYSSLRKRNFPPYIAASTWLIDEIPAYELQSHPRFYTIYYEDLVAEPYQTVTKFSRWLGYDISESVLAKLYKENKYRALFSKKISSWTVNEYGRVENANQKQITNEDLIALGYMVQSRINDGYAKVFGLRSVSFSEIVHLHGYEFGDTLKENQIRPQWPDRQSQRQLFRKWYLDFLMRDAKLTDLFAYLQPTHLI